MMLLWGSHNEYFVYWGFRWEFPRIRGRTLGPHITDYSILGSLLGSICFGKLPWCGSTCAGICAMGTNSFCGSTSLAPSSKPNTSKKELAICCTIEIGIEILQAEPLYL